MKRFILFFLPIALFAAEPEPRSLGELLSTNTPAASVETTDRLGGSRSGTLTAFTPAALAQYVHAIRSLLSRSEADALYQPLSSLLGALATNSVTGSGRLVLESVTDGKQPLAATLTALSTNTTTGSGRVVLETITDGKQPLASTLTALSSNSITGTGTVVLSSVTDGKMDADATGAVDDWDVPGDSTVTGTLTAGAVSGNSLAVGGSGTNEISLPLKFTDLSGNAYSETFGFSGSSTNGASTTLWSMTVPEGYALKLTADINADGYDSSYGDTLTYQLRRATGGSAAIVRTNHLFGLTNHWFGLSGNVVNLYGSAESGEVMNSGGVGRYSLSSVGGKYDYWSVLSVIFSESFNSEGYDNTPNFQGSGTKADPDYASNQLDGYSLFWATNSTGNRNDQWQMSSTNDLEELAGVFSFRVSSLPAAVSTMLVLDSAASYTETRAYIRLNPNGTLIARSMDSGSQATTVASVEPGTWYTVHWHFAKGTVGGTNNYFKIGFNTDGTKTTTANNIATVTTGDNSTAVRTLVMLAVDGVDIQYDSIKVIEGTWADLPDTF